MAKLTLKPPNPDQLWPFPEWLPRNVRQAVKWFKYRPAEFEILNFEDGSSEKVQQSGSIEGALWADDSRRLLIRKLTTNPRMRDAWSQLEQTPLKSYPGRKKSQQRRQLIRGYLRTAIWPGIPESYWDTVPTTAKQREQLEKMAHVIGILRRDIGHFLPAPGEGYCHTAWQTLRAGLHSWELPLALQNKLIRLYKESTRIKRLRSRRRCVIDISAAFGALPDMLSALEQLTDFASKQPLPKSRNRAIKKRRPAGASDFLIKQLNAHAQIYLTRPCHKAIAATVTVALDLSSPLKSDDVRKRLASHRRNPVPPPTGKNSSIFV